ncbi:PAN2-PAN3 deadenylation complex subunit PAN3 [Cercospora zeina]
MANVTSRVGDSRRSNRHENRPPGQPQLCRNGPNCRKREEGTCFYNHDYSDSMSPNGSSNTPNRALNVQSPAFTPTLAHARPAKPVGISPKTAAAATFTPRGAGSSTPVAPVHGKHPSAEFVPQQPFQQVSPMIEFVPGQQFVPSSTIDAQAQTTHQYNPYSDNVFAPQTLSGLDGSHVQLNPYAQQSGTPGVHTYYHNSADLSYPLNYHLYAPFGPRRENMAAYQRSTTDFFIPDDLREDLQRKSEMTLQTFANSNLPQSVEHFHSLVALNVGNSKSPSTFGYASSVYKATSSNDGHTYALRRIAGFRLHNEAQVRPINAWKRMTNASLVTVIDAFTGRWFGDSSLIIVTDYHPRSQSLAEKYFGSQRHANNKHNGQLMPENELWGYIVQLASALRTIHGAGQAAQTVMASKVLLTSKNRIRLNGCGVFDIVQYDKRPSMLELQRADLQDLGKLILGIATRNQMAHQNVQKALDLIGRSYSERFRSCVAWLLAPPPIQQDPESGAVSTPNADYSANALLANIADKIMVIYDSALHYEDEITSQLVRELENGRVVRLLTKLAVILERPDISLTSNARGNSALLNQPSASWSETGERYYLKLFRDFVFHQVDAEGRPVLDLGHMLTCLNKVDAGIDEKIQLVSRDEESVFIVSYKEVKRGIENAWMELLKASNPARR